MFKYDLIILSLLALHLHMLEFFIAYLETLIKELLEITLSRFYESLINNLLLHFSKFNYLK